MAYALGRSDHETAHLQERAVLWDPSTRRLFQDAGISKGMRVLDVGSGAGDVALLASQLVGPKGSVVGVDIDPGILETARRRARATGSRHATFIVGDIRDIDLGRDFDAVVGRLILQYVPDALTVLNAAHRHLRPGGVVAFQEADWTAGIRAVPPSPLLDQVARWIEQAFRRSGSDIEVGVKLRTTLRRAGFLEPQLHADRFMGGGPNWVGYKHLAGLARSLLPVIEAEDIARAAELAVDTLADRLRDEILASDSVVFYTTLVSAWASRP
jgi:ubiquinone/menaquinone biosynthesis C-methylase UbiE